MRQNRESKLQGVWMRMVLCLLVLSATGTMLVAQQSPDKPVASTDTQDVKPSAMVIPNYSQTIALLGTDQRYMDLETLQTRRRTFFLYGMGLSESYVQIFNENSASQDNSQFLWSPHVAIINASNHSSFSFQYAPSLVQSTSGPSSREVFHSGTITFGQPLSPNWVLQVVSTNTYGTDSSRLLSPLAFDVSKGVPVADPSSAVFQLNRGKVFTTGDSVGLSWQTSPSQALNFSVQESYFTSLDSGASSRATSAQVSYSAAVSPRTSFNVGGNYHHQEFTIGNCDGYGFNIGVSHQVGRHIELSLEAGPEFETSPCSRTSITGNYGISISYPLSRRSRVAVSASRSYLTNYLADTLWSDTAAVSYARQLTEYIDINVNSGYARSVRAQPGLEAYVGYFAGVDLSWKLSRAFTLETAYKRFEQVSGGPGQGQNIVLISLGWNPLPVRIVK
jgi:hypothetical protein